MSHSRRKFIRSTTLASASFLPIAKVLSNYLGTEEDSLAVLLDKKFNKDPDFHLLDNNLLNLHFYFLNTKKKRSWLRPANYSEPSFVIVRLPQQHITEKGYWDAESKELPNGHLSGYSFLAFQLWPKKVAKSDEEKRKLKFSIENFLDWNNQDNYKLITLVEWMQLKNVASGKLEFAGCKPADNFASKKRFEDPDILPVPPASMVSAQKVFVKYKSIIKKLLEGNSIASNPAFIPVSFFEVPQKLFFAPLVRVDESKEKISAQFFINEYLQEIDRKNKTRKYEIWHNTLYYKREKLSSEVKNSNTAEFSFEKPGFRAIGYYSSDTKELDCTQAIMDCDARAKADEQNVINDGNVLPTLLDKKELTYLTQFAYDSVNKLDHTAEEFDLKELNGFFFTGLGIITHLKYYNVENKPLGIDLIEYEHIITQGRDIFIKVARLGFNNKTGQRYKHVIEGKRIISQDKVPSNEPASFISLDQYCECIEKEIAYDQIPDGADWDTTKFAKPVVPAAGIPEYNNPAFDSKYTPHFRRHIFTSLQVVEKERIPIDCLQDQIIERVITTLQCKGWFWPVRKNRYEPGDNGTVVKLDDYYNCECTGIDWENKAINGSFPFMFIRASTIENGIDGTGNMIGDLKAAHDNYFREDCHQYWDRRISFLNNQKVAFTPPLPNPPPAQKEQPSFSRPNVLETESVDIYHGIRKTNGLPAQKVKGLVTPQVLKGNVYFDHIRDITLKKISSVVEHHKDYIDSKFEDYRYVGTDLIGNGTKLILKNTEAFIAEKERGVRNTYGQIGQALNDAKNRLGNLVVPDIIPDSMSLDPFGFTLPRDIKKSITEGRAFLDNAQNGMKKLASLSPRELLRGKLSEILGGIDLREILDLVLPADSENNATPLFELQKLLNQIDDVIKNSSVYQSIVNFKLTDPFDGALLTPSELIDKYEIKVDDFKEKVRKSEEKLNAEKSRLSKLIPNSDEVNALVKQLFEKYRTQAYEIILSTIHFDEVRVLIEDKRKEIALFIENEKFLLINEFNAKKDEVNCILKDINKEIASLAGELVQYNDLKVLIDQVGGGDFINDILLEYLKYFDTPANLQTFLDTAFKNLTDATKDDLIFKPLIDGVRTDVYIDIETFSFQKKSTPLTASLVPFTLLADFNTGFIQMKKKVDDMALFIERNVDGNDFQRKVTGELQKEYTTYKAKLTTFLNNLTAFGDRADSTLAGYAGKLNQWLKLFEDKYQDAVDRGLSAKAMDIVIKIKSLVQKANPYIDFLRKIDPWFYYTEQKRITKEIEDIRRRFEQDIDNARDLITEYQNLIENKVESLRTTYNQAVADYKAGSIKLLEYANRVKDNVYDKLNKVGDDAILELEKNPAYAEAKVIFENIKKYTGEVEGFKTELKDNLKKYIQIAKESAVEIKKGLEEKVLSFIEKKEGELIDAVGVDNILAIQNSINDAKNIYRLITSIRKQDLTYHWNTINFRDVSFGIITFKKFSGPDTQLKVDVKATAYFAQGQFPPVIDRVEYYSENRLLNFGVGFFSALTIGFNEVSFVAGTNYSTDLQVKIKDVKFEGALSFVQKFEDYLKTIGKGLILQFESDHFLLGYSFPIPAIKTPGFNFFNLSLNFDFKLYFDKRPMRFGFSLARPDSKFTIAAGIYAGFGYFSISGEPKRGIVEIDIALEAGAWAGLSLGPIHGEVKLAFGFRFTKNEFGVRLEGYIVAEGRLTLWILEISARIYLGVVSQNSVVEGMCSVSYSVKLGFFKKSFTGTFRKKIAGANANNNETNSSQYYSLVKHYFANVLPAGLFSSQALAVQEFNEQYNSNNAEVFETECVTEDDWKEYFNKF